MTLLQHVFSAKLNENENRSDQPWALFRRFAGREAHEATNDTGHGYKR